MKTLCCLARVHFSHVFDEVNLRKLLRLAVAFTPHEFVHVARTEILVGPIHALECTFHAHPVTLHMIRVLTSHRIYKVFAVISKSKKSKSKIFYSNKTTI